ncbi:MAG: AAA family ATPase [Clostridia bacterium]|nr:AAA family ATPase [Clostridia bacterium]
MKVRINKSLDLFGEIRRGGFYYVDKTMVMKEYLVDSFSPAILLTRPRRFGKTMTLTMLRDFLDIGQDSREIFRGLKIMDCPDVVGNYMNQYPVIFLSLKEVFGRDFEETFVMFRNVVSTLCKEMVFLLESTRVNPYDRELLEKLMGRDHRVANPVEVLDLLSRMLCAEFGKPVFVLIDEYDVPMAKAAETPHYDQVRDMIEHMLSYVCKTNENVKGVLLSGCLYTLGNSTYTGVNNIAPCTVLSPVFADSIGFTDEEVRKLLADAGVPDRYDAVTEWYDGYLFGREKMFCPWDGAQLCEQSSGRELQSGHGP